MTVAVVKEAVSAGARLESACKEIGIDARTLQRWTAVADSNDRRRGPTATPSNALTKAEEDDVVALLNADEFAGLSPHQVVAKLADMNIYKASERTMYRILRRRKLMRHRDRSRPRTARRPNEHVATGPRQVWSWDITYLRSPIKGTFRLLYMVVDVWSRKVVAARVHANESDQLASVLIEDACRREGVPRGELVIHSDNGPAMKGKTVLAMMQDLGVVPSFSRPRVSNDNPFSEALFRTMKYRPGYPDQPFPAPEAAQAWVDDFVRWYNEDHQHSGIRFVTPVQRHDGHENAILVNRARVYAAAKARTPDRWARTTRNWSPVAVVRLNPRPASAKETPPAKLAKGARAGVAGAGATDIYAAGGPATRQLEIDISGGNYPVTGEEGAVAGVVLGQLLVQQDVFNSSQDAIRHVLVKGHPPCRARPPRMRDPSAMSYRPLVMQHASAGMRRGGY